MELSRRQFLVASISSYPVYKSFFTAHGVKKDGRVIVLGFDGVEPKVIKQMMDREELPSIAKLVSVGEMRKLKSTIPPQSPTAWSSFATSKNPGQHGIYDFIKRDPTTYFPGVSLGVVHPPEFDEVGNLKKAPYFESFRKGRSFWCIADEAGARCKVLNMPYCFPPDNLKNGIMLSGLGVPEIRGVESFFYAFSDKFNEEELKKDLSGGTKIKLIFHDKEARVELPVFRNPIQKEIYEKVDITFIKDADNKQVIVKLPKEKEIVLKEGEISPWVEWEFQIPKTDYIVSAISRFWAREIGENVFVYMTPLQYHPENPYIPFTNPPSYSSDLLRRYGFYKTIGWNYDTHALRQDVITEEFFIEDVKRTMRWKEQLILDEISKGDFNLLIGVWTATDRVAHLFWRFTDPSHPMYDRSKARIFGKVIEDTYKIMDKIVGNVLATISDNDLFILISDHGFTSYRRGFNLTTWLIREGYLVVEGQLDPATSYNESPYLQGYDWRRTKAYALGLGSVYINLEGREARGIVSNSESEKLIDEIKSKLLLVKDPATGKPVVKNVYTRSDYSGEALSSSPDLILGYCEGYQTTKSSAKGSAPKELFEDNMDKWSGDHVGTDYTLIPGLFVINRKVSKEPDIKDIAPTALSFLGVQPPDDLEGSSLI